MHTLQSFLFRSHKISQSTLCDSDAERIRNLLKQEWTHLAEEDGMTASILAPPPDAPCRSFITKGEALVEGVEIEEMIALFQTPSVRPLWDTRTDYIEVKEVTKEYALVFAVSKPFWPVSSRELLVKIKPTYYDQELQAFVISQASVEDDRFPISKSRIRATVHISVNIFQATANGVKITTIGQLDFGGTVPTSLINFALRAAPLGVGKLIAFGRQHGIPPKLVTLKGDAVTLKEESFHPPTRLYKAKLTSTGHTQKRLHLDPILYPTPHYKCLGVQVQMEGNFLLLSFEEQDHVVIVIGNDLQTVDAAFQ